VGLYTTLFSLYLENRNGRSQETKKSRHITFRLTSEQYEQVENAALAAGEDPNSWCRRVALVQLIDGFGLTKNDRLIYEEIARVRYLVGHGFRMLIGGQDATAEMWKKTTADADYHREVIADDLLSRRQRAG
jgi:hypothetical protein